MKRIITNHSFLFALGMIAGFLDMGTHHFLELAVWMIPFVVYGIISSDSLKSRAMVLSFSAGALISVSLFEAFFGYPSAFRPAAACIASLAAYCTGIVFRGGFFRSIIYGLCSMTGVILLEEGPGPAGAGILIGVALEMKHIAGQIDPDGSAFSLRNLLPLRRYSRFPG
ncbi:MAG: hypothetical protein E7190_05600 [Erysipelotrichaceae bacterium]|nr:hypothetical protein [Erysipelotrichaceae bacterium]